MSAHMISHFSAAACDATILWPQRVHVPAHVHRCRGRHGFVAVHVGGGAAAMPAMNASSERAEGLARNCSQASATKVNTRQSLKNAASCGISETRPEKRIYLSSDISEIVSNLRFLPGMLKPCRKANILPCFRWKCCQILGKYWSISDVSAPICTENISFLNVFRSTQVAR